jgi:hypothetical protein
VPSNTVPYGKRPKRHPVPRVQVRYNNSIKLRHNTWKKTSKCQSDSSLVYTVNEAGSVIQRKSHGRPRAGEQNVKSVGVM